MSPHLKKSRSSNTPHALTLIEAIVVVIIMSLLIAILLPTLSHGGPRPIASTMKNMRQIALACLLYASDNSGTLPSDINFLSPNYLTDKRCFHDLRLPSLPFPLGPILSPTYVTPDFFYAGANLNLGKLGGSEPIIILYDKAPNPSFRIIALSDGHVECDAVKDIQHFITATNTARAAQHLPPLPADLLSAPQSTTLPANQQK